MPSVEPPIGSRDRAMQRVDERYARPPLPAAVLVFAKAPRPGHVKTRLAQEIGARRAAECAAAFLGDTLERLACWGRAPIWLLGDGEAPAELGTVLHLADRHLPQGPGDLGERLARGFAATDSAGFAAAIALGADTPHLDLALLDDALLALSHAPVVLGPAADGGYWLLGVRSGCRAESALFRRHAWGESGVLESTRSALSAAGTTWVELENFWDIDRAEDLVQLQRWSEDGRLTVPLPRRTLRLLARRDRE